MLDRLMKSTGRTQVCLGPSISRNPQPPFFQWATADTARLDSRMAGRRGFEGSLCGRRSGLPACKPRGKGYIPLLDRPKIHCELGRRRIAGRRQSVRATLKHYESCVREAVAGILRATLPLALMPRPVQRFWMAGGMTPRAVPSMSQYVIGQREGLRGLLRST